MADSKYNYLNNDSYYDCARVIVPIVLKCIQNGNKINSILDLGCGMCIWLAAFKDYGVEYITGVDEKWVDKTQIYIPPENFLVHDLNLPIRLGKSYDLAVSIEVAEHLPAKSAKVLIDSLCSHSDIVLFSAAIPGQGGTHHVNCQYPSYWASLFKQNGYSCADIIRPQIWNNDNLDVIYRQNMVLYVKNGSDSMERIKRAYDDIAFSTPIDAIHPSITHMLAPVNTHLLGLGALIRMQKVIITRFIPCIVKRLSKMAKRNFRSR